MEDDDEVEALKSVAVAVHVIGDDGKGDAGVDIGRQEGAAGR